MPPNVPKERVEAIRHAFDAAMKDKELQAEAEKLKIEIDPLTGEQVAALIVDIYKTPAETVARVRDAMAPK
jgi:tripartite-type tricarboxylate transporter receptor subunit TctC